ncbi:MAG: cyclic pyranopterin monophosphate synthase MoaC [Acidimicrobiia bacterium]|nr:cyclic pyranopterin monophosphate synthase MoaC [Acidimicrobiia bacterium]
MADDLTHLDGEGRARMVDVGGKEPTRRVAVAESVVEMTAETRDLMFGSGLPKGDAVAVARVAGLMAAKRTAELIPLCHPLRISHATVDIEPVDIGARALARVETVDRTGVEMEAMVAASVTALTIYDMVKGVERGAAITATRLLHKSGGKSGEWNR